MIRLKRAYDPPADDDGARLLVERLWPRGISKERGRFDAWLKDVAPSAELRTWYSHDVEKWNEFRRRYRAELLENPEIDRLRAILRREKTVTFVYAARDEEHNSAKVLKEFLEARRPRSRRSAGEGK